MYPTHPAEVIQGRTAAQGGQSAVHPSPRPSAEVQQTQRAELGFVVSVTSTVLPLKTLTLTALFMWSERGQRRDLLCFCPGQQQDMKEHQRKKVRKTATKSAGELIQGF